MVFALLAVTAVLQAPADSLYGIVRAAGTGEGIPGVRVSVRGHAEVALTDSAGRYLLHHHLQGKRLALLFERIGFEPLAVDVLAGTGSGDVDVDLAPAAIALTPLAVVPMYVAPPAAPGEPAETGRFSLTRV